MRMKLFWSLLVSIACICSATNLAAKSDAIDSGYYTAKDKEFYLTPEQLLFIRPGLVIEIMSVELPADMQMEVTYSIKDPAGLPLDHDGIYTPGKVDMRFTLANIPMGEEQKVRLTYERISRNGTLTEVGDGVYKYKFDLVLASDLDTTHTLVLGGRRDLREFELDRYADNDMQTWVPSGMYDAVPRDIVTTDTCDRCHGTLNEHGRWQSPQACTQCHNEVGNTRFEVLIHATHAAGEAGGHDFSHVTYPAALSDCQVCHTGGTPTENFPLVANPATPLVCDSSGVGETTLSWGDLDEFEIHMDSATGPLFASGAGEGSSTTGKWVADGTVFVLVDKATGDTVQELTVNNSLLGCIGNEPGTPRGTAAAQHTNWLDHPSRAVCGSCHSDIDFEAGEGHIVQSSDSSCGFCHKPTGAEFDKSVMGAHQQLYKSVQLSGFLVDILSVTDTDPGDTPTVMFSLKDKSGTISPAGLAFFNLIITGPNDDFDFFASERATNAMQVGDNFSYTFNTPLPSNATGSFTAGAEIFNMVPVDMGDGPIMARETAENPVFTFAVTDAVATPRRMVVDDYKCESCHANLALHGTIRHEAQYCNTCHQPLATDLEEVQEGNMEQTIHFKYMIHSIHRGVALENGFVVAGHNQSIHDYGEVEYPGDLRNCDACHVNDSQQLPLDSGLLPTMTPQALVAEMQPEAAACLSCHDGDSAVAHAVSNTAFFGESCSTCHGEGKSVAVDKVHAQ
jgi:hypothetical protein